MFDNFNRFPDNKSFLKGYANLNRAFPPVLFNKVFDNFSRFPDNKSFPKGYANLIRAFPTVLFNKGYIFNIFFGNESFPKGFENSNNKIKIQWPGKGLHKITYFRLGKKPHLSFFLLRAKRKGNKNVEKGTGPK